MNELLNPKIFEGQFPQFSAIQTQDFVPACKEIISRAKDRVVKLKEVASPTFETLIEPLETSLRQVGQVSEIFSLFSLSHSSEEFKKIEPEIAELFSAFNTELFSDVQLFEQIKAVHAHRDTLAADQRRLVENFYKHFIRTGCNLDETKKKRFKEISQELAKLAVTFGQNIQKSTAAFKLVVKESQLKGLSNELVEKMKANAKAENRDGYLLTLEPSAYIEIMEKADDRELRKALYFAWNRRAYNDNYDNTENVFKIARLKHELAQLLGYPNYASYVLEERMAKSQKTVEDFVEGLIQAYRPFAEQEENELREFVKTKGIKEFEVWDRAYWARKLLEEKYSFDEEIFKEYLVYEKVLDALFRLSGKLYKIHFKQNKSLPTYHPDTQVFEVLDSNDQLISYLITDPYARLGTKKHGAWMLPITPSYYRDGTRIPSIISVNTNYSKPEGGKELLLTIDEALTLFHEFGHALHGMLTKVRYASISGTNVLWDFVELPSQFMENFFYEKEILAMFAFHHKTGEPLPEHHVDGLVRFRRFRTANQAMRQISFIVLDMAWHTGKLLDQEGNLNEIERRLLEPVLIHKDIGDISTSASFSHIFSGGYSSGYYSYKWAEVLDADAFVVFKREGLLNSEIAQRFQKHVLEVGDSIEPMEAYVQFAGRPPKIEAMLERDGFTQGAGQTGS